MSVEVKSFKKHVVERYVFVFKPTCLVQFSFTFCLILQQPKDFPHLPFIYREIWGKKKKKAVFEVNSKMMITAVPYPRRPVSIHVDICPVIYLTFSFLLHRVLPVTQWYRLCTLFS